MPFLANFKRRNGLSGYCCSEKRSVPALVRAQLKKAFSCRTNKSLIYMLFFNKDFGDTYGIPIYSSLTGTEKFGEIGYLVRVSGMPQKSFGSGN